MTEVTTRELLQELAERPIGGDGVSAAEAGARASKIWLPSGKRPPEDRASRMATRERQIDIEDAVEAAGGTRGTMGVR